MHSKGKDVANVLCQIFILGELGMVPNALSAKKETRHHGFTHTMESIHGKAGVVNVDLIQIFAETKKAL